MKRLLSIGGLLLLVIGLVLLYSAFIVEPETKTVPLGASNQTAAVIAAASNGVVEIFADGQSTTIKEVGGETTVSAEDVMVGAGKPSDDSDAPEISEEDVQEQAGSALDPSLTGLDGKNPIGTNAVITDDTQVGIVGITDVGDSPALDVYEQRIIELEYPKVFRQGEAGAVRVTLKMLDNGQMQASAEIESNTVLTTPVLLTAYYDTHDAFVTANLVAPDFEVEDSSPRRQEMLPVSEVSWRWVLKPNELGNFIITFSVVVNWEPKAEFPTEQPKGPYFVAGNSVQTQVDRVFGLISIPVASIGGTIFALVGAISQIPGIMAIYNAYMERKTAEVRAGKKKSAKKTSRRS